MDEKIRKTQKEVLQLFSEYAEDFALARGTTLELFYLNHRFSADLDFFSPKYNIEEIERLTGEFGRYFKTNLNLENEFLVGGKAKVRFYSLPISGTERFLKIDFVEDVIFDNPEIKSFDKIRVYSVKNIYLQKIIAITGTSPELNQIGKEVMKGRSKARDVFDVYILSKEIHPLHLFLQEVTKQLQRGMVQWYRKFSRRELKLKMLDLDIYKGDFDSKEMIIYLENEIKKFIKGVV